MELIYRFSLWKALFSILCMSQAADSGAVFGAPADRITIPSGGTLNVQFGTSISASGVEFLGDGAITVSGGGGAWPILDFSSGGVLLKSGGAGISRIDPGLIVSAENLGVQADSGTLILSGNSTHYSGASFTIAAGALVQLVPDKNTAQFTGLFTGSGSGNLELSHGTASAVGGTVFDMPSRFFRWTGGVIAGPGFTNAGAINIATESSVGISGDFVNRGVVSQVLTGGLNIPFGSVWMNQEGSVFEIAGDSSISGIGGGGATPLFVNRGVLRKSAGAGESKVLTLFNNEGGSVQADAGTLILAGGGTSSNGFFSASSGAILDVTGGAAVVWEGLLQGGGAGTVRFGTGTVQAGSSGAVLDFPADSFQWMGGTLSGGYERNLLTNRGSITASGAGTKNISGLLINTGTLLVSGEGALNLQSGGTLRNVSGALVELQSEAPVTAVGGSGAAAEFQNSGLLRKTIGTGEIRIDPFLRNQEGTIEVLAGTLSLAGGSSLSNGSFSISAGAEVNLNTGSQEGIWSGHVTGAGPGIVALRNGVIRAGSGGLALDLPLGLFQWFGGALAGAGENGFTNTGAILLLGESGKAIEGTILNAGRLTQASLGALNLPFGSNLRNLPDGVIDLQSDGPLTANGGGGAAPSLLNEGLMVKTRGSNTVIDANIDFENADVLRVARGKLTFPRGYHQSGGLTELAGGTLFAGGAIRIDGGLITGSGSIDGTIVNQGTIRPGTNTLQISGDLNQLSAGVVAIEITPGNSTGLVQVAGTANLAGTLQISLPEGSAIVPGQEFTIMNYANRSGQFAGVSGTAFEGSLALDPEYRTNSLVLVARKFPVFRTVTYLAGTLSFSFSTDAGVNYQIETTESLSSPDWQPFQLVTGSGSIASFSFPVGGGPARFFRIRQL